MSCTNCSNNSSGVPNGCKSNGNCASGGCDKMSVFNWLSDIQLPSGKSEFDVIEVSFKNGRKGFYRNEKNLSLYKGDAIAVETSPGYDMGVVSLTGGLVKHQMKRKNVREKAHELRKVYRKATEDDLSKWKDAREKEFETMHEARELIVKLKLRMKLGDVEYQGDGNKATFYYTAEQRVDFRELIKMMAERFKIKIEMRQIGSRQEAGRLGGLGTCGRELCCSTWLNDFRSVSTSAARYQQLALNPQKLSGQCGKLKCCLNFELDQYTEALKEFPDTRKPIQTAKGAAFHIKTDVFKRLMWYIVKSDFKSNIICLSVDRVLELQKMNKSGDKIESLTDFAEVAEVKDEPQYSNVVGQDDLTRFDNKFKKKKKKRNNRNKNRSNSNQKKSNTNQKQRTNNTSQKKQEGTGKKEGNSQPRNKNNNRRKNNRRNNNKQGDSKNTNTPNTNKPKDNTTD